MPQDGNATVKTTTHEEASRLPDTSWFWRRLLVFAVSGVCLFIAWRISERVPDTDVGTIRQINRYTYGLIALSLLLYGVGATITDVVKLMTAFHTTKKTTETTAPPPASLESTPEGGTKVTTPPGAGDQPAGDDAGELPPDQRVLRDT